MWPFRARPMRQTTDPVLSKDRVWPPAEHEERLARYERNRRIYRGEHFAVFTHPMRGADHDLDPQCYVTANIAAQVSHTASDLLFGEAPRFIADLPEAQRLIDGLVRENDLITQLQRAARGQSYRGDAVFKVRWDLGRAVIECARPDSYFPVYDPQDPQRLLSVVVAWLVSEEGVRPVGTFWPLRGEPRAVLRMEVHTRGRIENLAFPYRNGRLGAALDVADVDAEAAPLVETGIDEIPLVHIANMQTDDSGPFGLSDYAFFESIQAELNNRLSQVSSVLDKHADPNMIVPLQALDTRGSFKAVSQKAWPLDPGDVRPEYVTWDGQLDAAFREIELLKELFFVVSGVSPTTLGVSRGGASEESGRAIQLRQLRTLKWIENKRAAWTHGLKAMFRIAQKLTLAHSAPDPNAGLPSEPVDVQILWNDGLPTDRTADIEDAVRGVQGGVMSVETGIRLAQGLEGEQLAAEEARIRAGAGK